MKNETNRKNPYATNKGGRIESPNGTPKDEPKSKKTVGTKDLRGDRK